MEKIKVGMIFHGEYPPHPRIENQALNLIQNNVEVFLFCVTYNRNEAVEKKYKGINLVKVYYPRLVYQLSALAYTFPLYHWILRKKISHFVTKNKIEYLHVHNMIIAQTVIELNKKFKLPVVLDIHENLPEIMKYYPHLKTRLGKLLINPIKWKAIEGEFIAKADKVIVVTEDAKDEVVLRTKITKDKVKVLPNFTNHDFLKATYDTDIINKYSGKFKVLYIGDTGERRGLISVVRSIKFLKEAIPNLAIIIVGKSKDDTELQKEIINENVSSYVFLEGWQKESALSDYVHMSDIGICPILRNLHHDTTYANKLFQYAMHGKAILASDCPSQAKLINDNKWGLIHEAGNEGDFANKLVKLHSNAEERIQFGTNGKESIAAKYNFKSNNFSAEFYKKLDK